MTITRFSIAFLILLAAATCGFAGELPPYVEQVLLRRLNAEKIIEVHDLRQRTIVPFDYLGLFASLKSIRLLRGGIIQRSFFRRNAPTPIGRRQSYFPRVNA